MEEKPVIKIKLTTVIIIMLVVVIIGLVGVIYFIKNENNQFNSENTVDTIIKDNDISQEDIINSENKDNVENTGDDENDNINTDKENNINNTDGKKYIQFDTEFYNIKDIAKDYRHSDNIKNYKDFYYDLDGDNVNDKITIEKNKEEIDEQSYIFKLNDVEFARHYDRPEIYIVDLNETDNNLEIVIFDEGTSDDPNYTIYSKKGKKMLDLKHIGGIDFKNDKKGTILINDCYNGVTTPNIFFNYCVIEDGKLEEKYINVEKIKDVELQAEYLYFSKDLTYREKLYQSGLDMNNLEKDNVEKLNKDITFKVLEFSYNKDEDGIEDYKIYVQLSDGRKGYIFHIQWAG